MDGPKTWVGIRDSLHKSMKGSTKLHSMWSGKLKGSRIYTGKGVINDGSGPPIALGHHSSWRYLESWEVTYGSVGDNCTIFAFYHVQHFVLKEACKEMFCRRMRPPTHGGIFAGQRPRWRSTDTWCTVFNHLLELAIGLMSPVFKGGMKAFRRS